MLLDTLTPDKTETAFTWQRKGAVHPLVMGCSDEKMLTLNDIKITTIMVEKPRSHRIETRTKGKREMKRLQKEAAQRMEKLIWQTEWYIFAYGTRGLYP